MILRICKRCGCTTQLSVYNEGEMCYAHTPDLTVTTSPEAYQLRRPQQPRRRVVSQTFVDNVPGTYDLDAADHDYIETGAA